MGIIALDHVFVKLRHSDQYSCFERETEGRKSVLADGPRPVGPK